MRTSLSAAVAAASFFLLVHCSPKASDQTETGQPGKAGGPCLNDGTCDQGLHCTAVGCRANATSGAGGADPTAGGSSNGGGTGNTPGAGGGGGGSPPGGGGAEQSAGGTGVSGDTGSGGTLGSGGEPPSTGGYQTCGGTTIDPSALPGCSTCNGGRCVPSADYPNAPITLLDECSPGNVCMPDFIVATQGNVLLPACTSVAGIEGRCASLCIPIVRSLSGVLPQGGCGPDDRCAPCSNPADGSWTGICNVGCDTGPTQPAFKFPSCCSDRGRCVPRADIPSPAASSLPRVDCAGSDDPVCVPVEAVTNPTYRFPPCTFTGQPGVCAPSCIVDAIPNGKLLGRGDCANPDDKCALCKNPLNGQPTGACP